MAAGARTSAAAPLSGRSGAAADATIHRGARLLAGFRRRVTLRPARGLLYSTAAMVATLRHAQSSFEPSTGKRRWSGVLGLVYVLWNSFSGQMLPREGKLVLVCIDILAFALFFAFELLLTVRRESGTYDKRFRSARVTYGSP